MRPVNQLTGASIVLALFSILAACGPPAPQEPVEILTEDVAPPIDAELSTEDDLKAVQRASPAISGLVPGDVPADLPLFSPSSVVDFGQAGGRAYVELDTPASAATVRRWLGERLPAAGWSVGAIGEALVQADRGADRVEYRLTDLGSGTRIRLEYEPR